jgi:hypothetical protein
MDLGFNSYYLAGHDHDLLYLGNSTAPWHLLQVDLNTRDTSHIQLKPRFSELEYRSLKINVTPPYFFIMDGTVPFILRGKLVEGKADPWMMGTSYFSRALPIDSNTVFIRALSAKNQTSTLGLIKKHKEFKVRLDTTLLEAQIDGVFDVDGMMLKNLNAQNMGYVYYYRNEFITMDFQLEHISRQRTIDTVQQASIKVARADRHGAIAMKAPPLIINKTASMSNDFLLIQSERLGRNESRDMLEQASIIDVYNYKKKTYEFSFYLYRIEESSAREFAICEDRLVALIGNKLTVYRTMAPFFNENPLESTKETTGQ